jgi:ferrous-iron efflux pump FieF
VATATLLVIVKLGAWLMTGSVAILSSLVDSLLDAMASLINLLAVRQALVPADREHRFGHGKAEPLAGLAQAAFITGSGILLMIEAIGRFLEPRALTNEPLGLGVMVFSLAVTLLLVSYQKRVVAATGSLAVGADSLHYAGDILLNGSAILAILAAWLLDWRYADPVFAMAIGGFLMANAWKIGRSSLQILMDRELPDEERDRIKAICAAHPAVRAVHELRTRWDGSRRFIQMHLEMDPNITLAQAHLISVEVENQILALFPNAEVIIHEDPADAEPPALTASA